MISPIIICDGVIRSGSTWSYNVCRLLGQIRAKRRGEPFGMACLGADSLDHFLQVEARLGAGSAVIKVHEFGTVALDLIRAGKLKAVCTFRDPRDCVASDLVFWGAGFDASVERVAHSFDYLHRLYETSPHTLFIRYEEMIENPIEHIRKIAGHLQVAVDDRVCRWVDAQSNIEFSRAICAQLASRPIEQVDVGAGDHRRDRLTLLHDNHIGSAKAGRWREDLTAEQGELLTQMFRRSLQILGYDAGAAAIAGHPKAPQDIERGQGISGAVEQ